MENPATWGVVRKTIAEAIQQHSKLMRDGFCGVSLPTLIYNALANRGMVSEDKAAPKQE